MSDPFFGNTSEPEVRGYSVYDRPAAFWVRGCSWILDAGITFTLIALAWTLLDLPPMPEWYVVLPIALAAYGSWIAQKAFVGGTVGQRVWRLHVLTGKRRRPKGVFAVLFAKTFQRERLNGLTITAGACLTALAVATTAYSFLFAAAENPLLRPSREVVLQPFAPGTSSQWMIAPFFYSIGAWPVSYAGRPVFFSLPYEKGPPAHFLGHIVARWDLPETQLTIEGPKTPFSIQSRSSAGIREALRGCILNLSSADCLRLRRESLDRHIREMREGLKTAGAGRIRWQLRWFRVENPALPAAEQPQGVHLSASNGIRAQERYLLITPKGALQAFILNRPPVELPAGELASRTLGQAIQSQRVSEDLNSGRAWVDRLLSDMQALTPPADGETAVFTARLAAAQLLLLSKLSVDPRSVEGYYHLAGTASLLTRLAAKKKDAEWTAASKPMVQTALKYAQDVAPGDKHIPLVSIPRQSRGH